MSNPNGVRPPRLASLCVLVLLATFLTPLARAGEEVTMDGVPHIKNGTTPTQGHEMMELEELWSAGGEDDEDVLFGLIAQARVGDDGNIYLLDLQLSEIQVFSPDGEYLTSLSREGEGPGEVRMPRDFVFLSDGSIGILQTFPGKIVKIGRDGIPAGEVVLSTGKKGAGGQIALLDAGLRGGNFVVAGVTIEQAPPAGQNRHLFLAHYSEDGKEQNRYAEHTIEMDFSNFDFHEREQYFGAPQRWALGPDGRVYFPPKREAYVIEVYAPDGTLERVIEREFTTPQRTAERMELLESARDSQIEAMKAQGMDPKIGLCETEPAISGIHVTEDGMIWVLTPAGTQDQPEGVMATYDVFDPAGHFVKQVSAGCEGDGENDALFPAGEDRLIKVTDIIAAAVAMQGGLGAEAQEESEPMEVVCYRIVQ
ncbi:MAG: 6-bladed beta-propeller [Candidatus Eisenbacteria bacterium]|nr:6-bladed beta-propeller [Candidatus Eisenbacteria bacterium]